jgi:hypothetical protein
MVAPNRTIIPARAGRRTSAFTETVVAGAIGSE